eukprot:CAMPEP_0172526526 /NCGR_PEP_ID=MMETSP1067-20121228/1431_1 /TAXON_ID=265564 ORGANISM="Thalassiosira punctigera, Strain Tpunct2005C2" /NCGR_SAMPLE_ID=MMETSP1067 /ASSEMBLY_ACC=CAM_ASM_000444 /LENGTH=233 /DNA_ID=CAMNT_0013310057 /DNA_START=320 /DNA_END=1021 /DNA_ORIENTATION=+
MGLHPPSILFPLHPLDARDQPIEPLEQSLPLQRARLLDGPLSIPHLRQSQRVADLPRVQRPLLILLVREHQQYRIAQLLFLEHGGQLAAGDVHALDVGRVDDEDDGVGVGVVAPPVGADGGLSSQVPHLKLYILILQRLHVEPDRGDGLHRLVALVLQPVEDGRLPGVVQAEDEDPHLLRSEEALEEPAHDDPHDATPIIVSSCRASGQLVYGEKTSDEKGGTPRCAEQIIFR